MTAVDILEGRLNIEIGVAAVASCRIHHFEILS